MKWLLEMDEDVRTGFLLGTFVVTGLFIMFFFNPVYLFIPFIFLAIWIYTLIKTDKNAKTKQQNNSV